jgi:peptide deformylase
MQKGWTNKLRSEIIKDVEFLHNKCEDINSDQWIIIKSRLSKFMKIPEAVGVACNQVGINKNGFAIDLYADKPIKIKKLMFFKNPKIELIGTKFKHQEQCMSCPGDHIVERTNKVIITDDENGKQEFSGYLAVIIQHEFNHINGILITDRK